MRGDNLYDHLQRSKRRRENACLQHLSATLLLSYLVLPTVSQVQFRGLNCFSLPSEKLYLRIDTAVECSTASRDYQLILAFTLPLIMLYQSIPLL